MLRSRSALLGEHTEEILREAGYDDEEVADFITSGIARKGGVVKATEPSTPE